MGFWVWVRMVWYQKVEGDIAAYTFFQGIIFWGWFQIFQPGFVLPSIFTKGRPGVEARNIVREAPWIKATILVPLQQFCCLFRMDFETFGPEMITLKMIFNVQKQRLLLITYISYLEIPTGFHDPFNIIFGQLLPILTIQRKKDLKPSPYLFILWYNFLGVWSLKLNSFFGAFFWWLFHRVNYKSCCWESLLLLENQISLLDWVKIGSLANNHIWKTISANWHRCPCFTPPPPHPLCHQVMTSFMNSS